MEESLLVTLKTRLAVIGIMLVLASCAGSGPYRSMESGAVSAALESKCRPLYAYTDDRIKAISTDFQGTDADRETFLEGMRKTIADTPPDLIPCWQTAYERHPRYDLYYAEFDDAGQATDLAKGTVYDQSQLHLIETSIKSALSTGKATSRRKADTEQRQGLNIVVFTHGWHGNARADNDYSIEFKAILQDIALAETNYRARLATRKNLAAAERLPRRVVGIEIAWRGDSLLTPALPFYADSKNALNVWDRKITAETVSTGSVQELLAFLNEMYLDNSCHGGRPGRAVGATGCDRVHLLSIGHSFGALINFRALVPRLESGLNVPPCYRVFGFGDMTILLNPAFEGARYRGLFNNAINRKGLIGPYFGAETPADCPDKTVAPTGEVQIPSIVLCKAWGIRRPGTSSRCFGM